MDNKPLETDDPEESVEDLFEEPSEETPQEPGVEDVGGLTLEELNKVSGREFKSKEEYLKHYENLKNFVGKRQETPKSEVKPKDDGGVLEKLSSLEQRVSERDFIYETPDAKEHLDLVRSVSKADGIPMQEAWGKVKDYVGAFEASKKEKTVVESKNRPNAPQTKEFQALAEKARTTGLNENEQSAMLKAAGVV
jgi:hypothetical protein